MDEQRYGQLLAEHRPRLIETPEEHERLLLVAETLMEQGENLGEEEEQLLALIVLLIEAFETHHADLESDEAEPEITENAAPHETLKRLLQAGGLDVSDIADIFGNPHVAREVLSGQKPISRSQAKQLSKFFRVPEKLFRD